MAAVVMIYKLRSCSQGIYILAGGFSSCFLPLLARFSVSSLHSLGVAECLYVGRLIVLMAPGVVEGRRGEFTYTNDPESCLLSVGYGTH